MDGVIGDKVHNGRRIRRLTTDEAISILPALIMETRAGRVQVVTSHSAGGPDVVLLHFPSHSKSDILLIREDFLLFKKVLLSASQKLFRTDTLRDVESRVRSWVALEFAGRP
jgi:hypothetical protein